LATGAPYATIKNSTAQDVSVTLQGIGKTEFDEATITWVYSGSNLAIQANGTTASITALGTGNSRETITVSHPKAAYPLSFAVIRYDTEAERDSTKLIYAETPYHTLNIGEIAYLAVSAVNLSPTDTLVWQITNGGACIALNQMDKSNATVTALSAGTATVTAALAGTEESVTFQITVKREGVVNPDIPCYLTTSQNVLVLGPGGEGDVTVIPVNISESSYSELIWATDNTALVEISANGAKATVRSVAGGGKATVRVSHPLATNTLDIHIHIGDEYEYKNTNVAYIDTPSDTLLLHAGDEDTVFQAVLAHTEKSIPDTTGFSFSIKNTTIATVSFSSNTNTCFISPKSPGQTILTITHAEAVYDKEVLIIVDRAAGDAGSIPYITTTQNVITVVSGEYATATVTLANAVSHDPAAWEWKAQDTRIAQIIVNNGSTAMIKGDAPGTTFITVFHPDSPHSLRLIIMCLDAAIISAKPYIKTNTSIATIKKESSVTITAEMIGGNETDHAGFVWSSSDSAFALISGSGNTVSVRGMNAGMTYITVRNTNYPESYAKTILVLVEDTIQEGTYITVNQRVVKMKPDGNESVSIKATLVGGEVLDPQYFVWWVDDYAIVNLTSITDTARIEPRGISGSTIVHLKHPKALETVDIVVLVSAFETFGFESRSKTIKRGSIAFIPKEKPPTTEKK
jgi:hypothetical protein